MVPTTKPAMNERLIKGRCRKAHLKHLVNCAGVAPGGRYDPMTGALNANDRRGRRATEHRAQTALGPSAGWEGRVSVIGGDAAAFPATRLDSGAGGRVG
jgi:hypothetical protein